MDDFALTSAERALLAALNRRGVRYLLIGLSAAVLQGAPVSTQDLDLWIEHPGDEAEQVCHPQHPDQREPGVKEHEADPDLRRVAQDEGDQQRNDDAREDQLRQLIVATGRLGSRLFVHLAPLITTGKRAAATAERLTPRPQPCPIRAPFRRAERW